MGHIDAPEEFDENFMKEIDVNPDWILIYYDNKQKLYVDKKHPRTRELFEGAISGKTIYPTDFSRYLILSYFKIFSPQPSEQDVKDGFDYAVKAFYLEPSRAPMVKVLEAANRSAKLKVEAEQFCNSVIDDYEKNIDKYKNQDGLHNRMETAQIAYQYLAQLAADRKDTKQADIYSLRGLQIDSERQEMSDIKRW